MYVDDAVDGIFKMLKSRKKDITVNFCSGKPIAINDLVKLAANLFGKYSIRVSHEGQVPEYNRFYASPQEMQNIFGFKPQISLKDGLMRFAVFLKSPRK